MNLIADFPLICNNFEHFLDATGTFNALSFLPTTELGNSVRNN